MNTFIHIYRIMEKAPTSVTQNLFDLFSVLNNKEKDIIVQHLSAKNHSHLLALFDQLTHDSHFFKQKSEIIHAESLYDAILEILLLDENIKQTSVYGFMNIERLHVRKRINQIQFIGLKSKSSFTISEYKNIIAQAKKYELYDELLILLYELLNIYSSNNKYTEYKDTEEEICHYETLRMELKYLFRLFNKYTLEINLFAGNKQIIYSLGEELDKLAEKKDMISSGFWQWIYHRLLIEYYQTVGKNEKSYHACLTLLNLQKAKKATNNVPAKGITYKFLAKACLLTYNFKDALKYIKLAQNKDNNFKSNIRLNKTIEFYIHFHGNNYSQALQCAKNIDTERDLFSISQNAYFQACCCCFISDNINFLKNLALTKDVEKDKEGWNIYIRLVQILQQLESKNTDVAQSYIESLRKHIERNKSREIHPRLLLIVKILRELVKENFNYKDTWQKHTDRFELLASESNEDYSWKILSPELIRFDVWFEAKVRRLTYQEIFREKVNARSN